MASIKLQLMTTEREENSNSGRVRSNKKPVPSDFTKEMHFVFQTQVSALLRSQGAAVGLQRGMKTSFPHFLPAWYFNGK